MHVLWWQSPTKGSIGWQNKRDTLPWQGYFDVKANGGMIDLAFDCYGRGTMKCARLYKVGRNVWEGFDYAQRFVRIEKIMEMEYCEGCKTWQITEAAEEDDDGYVVVVVDF